MIKNVPYSTRNTKSGPIDDLLIGGEPRKMVPHAFVLDAIARLSPKTRAMFGCVGVYVGNKIVMILCDQKNVRDNNGVWLATTARHHATLRREFPNMRSITIPGRSVTGWQVLPADALDFEDAALHACDLIIAGDARIGKVPRVGGPRVSHAKGYRKSTNRTKV